MQEYVLEMEGVCKSFPGVKALDMAQLHLRPGTVHALMGENGAGKSTLMKCLFGVYKMDEGEIIYNGEHVKIENPFDALQKGIAMVHQELQPIPERSIAENIYCGRYPETKILGLIRTVNHKKMYEQTGALLKSLGLNFDPKAKLGSLSVSQMQLVEIAKAVSANAKIVIMDEPTSSLTRNEVDTLFSIIHRLKESGCSIIYISHKMEEILQISDEVTIMRDGKYIGTWSSKELTTDLIITRMVGRELTNLYPKRENVPGDVILQVEDFTSIHPKSFRDVNFELRKGEILGVSGLVGAQRTELMEGIFGLRASERGTITYLGKKLRITRPKAAIENGIALLTEDRRGSGIFGVLSVSDNVSVASLQQYLTFRIMLNDKKIAQLVKDNVKKLSIKTPSIKTPIQSLSGGNQQKVIISRWLANDPDVLIMDEPTRGIDVGAKYDVYKIINRMADEGKAVLVISSELPELLGICDRIYIMSEGQIKGEMPAAEATQESIMRLLV